MTRPEPTIYGNCDSWEFIVGKKAVTQSPYKFLKPPLQARDTDFIHTYPQNQHENNRTTCG